MSRQATANLSLSTLCLKCREILQKVRTDDPEGNVQTQWSDRTDTSSHRHFDRCKAAAQAGCHLCRLIYSQLLRDKRYLPISGKSQFIDADMSTASFYTSVSTLISLGHMVILQAGVDLRHEILDLRLSQVGYKGPELPWLSSQSTGSDESFTAAKRWYEQCCSQHKCSSAAERILPTRLIHIEINDSHLIANLLPSKNLPSSTEYCSLSHCWGEAQICTLTKANQSSFEETIPSEILCKTFQDAFVIASRLGFHYVWIDSLCIIQDDPDDWMRESSTMSQVYTFSSLNIAATAAYDGQGGCFQTRDPLVVSRCVLPLASKLYSCFPENLWARSVEASPLASRAWILQERILAPRTLHYGDQQLFWECKCFNACETMPGGMDSYDFSRGLPHLPDPGDEEDANLNFWERLVYAYSRLSLTQQEDKLVALSGVSRMYAELTGKKYCAGLWREDLAAQLLWYVETECNARRPDVYVAPSWSWAAVIGNYVRPGGFSINRHSNFKSVARIESFDCAFRGPDGFGAVTSASLKLHGMPLRRAYCIDKTTLMSGIELDGDVSTSSYFLSVNIDVELEEPQSIEDMEVFLLVIVSVPPNPSWVTDKDLTEDTFHGLVLMRTRGEQGEYKRVGKFNERESSYSRFDVMEDESMYLKEGLSANDEKRYMISII